MRNNLYINISIKLYYKLNKLTLSFLKYYKEKDKITAKDKEIIKIVQDIYNKSILLRNFKNKNFYNKEDMKSYLVEILKEIKEDFKKIKKIAKKR
jgi:hypothetical protein